LEANSLNGFFIFILSETCPLALRLFDVGSASI